MGIMANTVSIYQYRVIGEIPPDIETWAGECLRKNAFTGIEATPDEEALGWVNLDDHLDSAFENPNTFLRGDYLFFTLRRDRRRVPGPFLKNMLTQECRRWLEHHPNFARVPSKRKAEIRDNLHVSLLPRTLPVPSTVDLVWNTASGVVTVAATNTKTLDLVEEEFRQSFAGLLLSPIHPMERARMLIPEALGPALTRADQAPSADVLLQIKKNRWVGWDFLLWLMYQTSVSGSRYAVTRPGPLEQGASFLAYVHEG
ncbi:MAG TPA: recombination-associated protein RdgC, partial [Deltaproteobacteria bacterium]|nr:recombination-associated protein RdgC [Deltaproteobacteria bacterium]